MAKKKHTTQLDSKVTAIQFIVDLLLMWLALHAAIFLRQNLPFGEPIVTETEVTPSTYWILFFVWGIGVIIQSFLKRKTKYPSWTLQIANSILVLALAEYLILSKENPSFSRLFLVFFPFTNLLASLLSWRLSSLLPGVARRLSNGIKSFWTGSKKRLRASIATLSGATRKTFSASFFIPNILVTLLTLLLYFIVLAWLTPYGVTRSFFNDVWKYLLGLIFVILLVYLIFGKKQRPLWKKEKENLSITDGILLLLPLTPIIQYIVNNQQILGIADALILIVIFSLFFALVSFGIPILLNSIGSTTTLMALGLAISFFVANMPAFSEQFSWFETGNITIQILLFFTIFLVIRILYTRQKNLLYLMLGVLFVSNSASQLYAPEIEQETPAVSFENYPLEDNELFEMVGDRHPVASPNIYLLVYDAYVPNETLLAYSIDNSAQEIFLKEMGFKLYPQTYSIGRGSINTMSRVLNASTNYYGLSRRGVSGDGVVQNLLKEFGYRTYGIFPSDFFFRGTSSSYDYTFPQDKQRSVELVSKAILTGEFRFDIGFNIVSYESYLVAKQDVFTLMSKDPVFLYTHSRFPGHSQNSGTCLPNETQLFEERLQKANLEMREDLELLIANEPNAIIVVAGDHGPSLTKTCKASIANYDISEITRLDVQDRFGTFLAIRWPSMDFEIYDDIVVLQDLFPSIFSFIFKDASILEAKIAPEIIEARALSGITVKNGIIFGGPDNGEPLFLTGE